MTDPLVVRLKPVQTRAEMVNAEVVKMLETWLEAAKAGEVLDVAIAGLDSTRMGRTQFSPTTDFFKMVGLVEELKHRMLSEAHL